MAKEDYITAISQTLAALRSINFSDAGVVQAFIQRLFADNRACIEMKSGKIVRPTDAVKMLG
jgi:hypothetical protein